MLKVGNSARYGPHVLSYSRHPAKNIPMLQPFNSSRALEDYLLPTTVLPLSYDLHLIPYLENPPEKNFTFDGEVLIRVRAHQPTMSIVMHAWDLAISQIGVIRVRFCIAVFSILQFKLTLRK
jgi:hypothetical protein